MSIERDGKGREQRIVVVCDTSGCTSTFDGEPGEQFRDAWGRAKEEGWRTRQIAGEWLHGCKSCGSPT